MQRPQGYFLGGLSANVGPNRYCYNIRKPLQEECLRHAADAKATICERLVVTNVLFPS